MQKFGKNNPQGITKGIAAGLVTFFIFFLYCIIANKLAIIPVGLIAAGAWSIYRGHLSSKSNSTTQVGLGTPNARVQDNTGNVPLVKTPQFWIGIALIFFGVLSAWMQISDYHG